STVTTAPTCGVGDLVPRGPSTPTSLTICSSILPRSAWRSSSTVRVSSTRLSPLAVTRSADAVLLAGPDYAPRRAPPVTAQKSARSVALRARTAGGLLRPNFLPSCLSTTPTFPRVASDLALPLSVFFDVLDGASGLNAIEPAKDAPTTSPDRPSRRSRCSRPISASSSAFLPRPPSPRRPSRRPWPNLDLDSLKCVNVTSF
ncbi:uncharacterized protein RHOBADRAFT_54362, partial [Rhodotorula graminis WP1]